MNNTIDVLVIVDAERALATGNLGAHVLLADSTGQNSSTWGAELTTTCHNGQTINWRVEAVSPSSAVAIVQFTGQAVSTEVIAPNKQTSGSNNPFWTSEVETRTCANYQYSIVLDLDGKQMTFDPFINVVK
ncbi:inclusion body family protein [Shewanella sp. AS16]|uniref:inclusion body family protein n=1 Tax=Shewanella sp. AS16 TaxID=2907625 RepID=UPI001F1F8269|nr:inclusion body family protein [Shewanella sp. AS16]MCE9685667.1 inclusion body family protein [Shewanella sp. AS16]